MNYLNTVTGEVISEACYNRLTSKHGWNKCIAPVTHRLDNSREGDFFVSMLVAEEAGSVAMGALAGGDVLGAVIGEELSSTPVDITPEPEAPSEFEGGESGGSGASDSY